MDVADLMSLASGSGPTLVLAGMVLGFFFALGQSARTPADWQHDPASLFAQNPWRTVLAGVKRLQDLHRRNATAPWDDLDTRFPVDRPLIRPDLDTATPQD